MGTRVPKRLCFSLSWLSLVNPAGGQCDQWPVTKLGEQPLGCMLRGPRPPGEGPFPFFFGAGCPRWPLFPPIFLAVPEHSMDKHTFLTDCFLLRLPPPTSRPPSSRPVNQCSLSRRSQIGRMPIFL